MQCIVVQNNISWEQPNFNLDKLTRQLQTLMPKEGCLVLLPEMFATGFSMNSAIIAQTMNGSIVQWLKNMAIQWKIAIAGTVAIIEKGIYYNRFVWAFPDGTIQFYDKRHLFRMGGENDAYQAGSERLIINYQGFRILPLICYDLRFPVWSRNRNDYDLLVYSANWPIGRQKVWNTLLAARAIENQAFVIGVNRIGEGNDIECSGSSQIIDFKGDIIVKGEGLEELILSASLDIKELNEFRTSFPVWQDADKFSI